MSYIIFFSRGTKLQINKHSNKFFAIYSGYLAATNRIFWFWTWTNWLMARIVCSVSVHSSIWNYQSFCSLYQVWFSYGEKSELFNTHSGNALTRNELSVHFGFGSFVSKLSNAKKNCRRMVRNSVKVQKSQFKGIRSDSPVVSAAIAIRKQKLCNKYNHK